MKRFHTHISRHAVEVHIGGEPRHNLRTVVTWRAEQRNGVERRFTQVLRNGGRVIKGGSRLEDQAAVPQKGTGKTNKTF